MTLVSGYANNNINNNDWKSWKWQQQNAIRNFNTLLDYFTNISPDFVEELKENIGNLKFQITPYLLSLIPQELSTDELKNNSLFMQFFPVGEIYTQGHDAYNGTDNWEHGEEFPTSNIQHKYTNRALIRFRNCFGYCNFCFEALGTLEKNPSPEKIFKFSDWEKSLKYIKETSKIEEVVLSGGEPLLMDDEKLEQILSDIDNVNAQLGYDKIRFKRIHTRVMTFNPYRITTNLSTIIRNHRVNEIALNIAHPDEITEEMKEAIGIIRETGGRYAPLIVSHTPLLNGINDNSETLWNLFSKLYSMNVKPYYLLHTMPHTPYADMQRVSVRDGVKLMKKLKRHKSNIAIPEYVIVHYDGKQTVPLELNGTPEFQYTKDDNGNPIVRFLNWKNKWVEYPDTKNKLI